MTLLICEWKKHWTAFHRILLAVLLALNTLISFLTCADIGTLRYRNDIREAQDELTAEYREDPKQYEASYDDYLSRLSAYRFSPAGTPFESLRIDVPGYDDRNLFDDIQKIVDRSTGVPKTMNQVIRSAYDRIRETGIQRGKYVYEYQVALLTHYEPLTALEIPVVPQYGWQAFFGLKSPVIFLTVACLVVGSHIFLVEKRNRTVSILSIQKRGGAPLIGVKLGVSVLFAVALTALFTLTALLGVWLAQGLSDPYLPLQSVAGFEACPYAISILEYFFALLGIRAVVMAVFTLFVTLLGQIMSGEIGVFLPALAVASVSYAMSYLPQTSPLFPWRMFNFFDLAFGFLLFERYRAVNVGFHMGAIPFASLLLALLTAGLLIISFLVKLKRRAFRGITFLKPKKKRPNGLLHPIRSRSLLAYEFDKNLLHPRGIGMVVLALCVKLLLSLVWFTPTEGMGAERIQSYMADLSGELGEAQESYLREERAYVIRAVADYEAALQGGEMDSEAFRTLKHRRDYAQDVEPFLKQVEGRYRYLTGAAERYERVEFVYDEGIVKYLTQEVDVVLLLLLLGLFSDVFSREYGSGFITILRLQKRGGAPVLKAKLLYGFLMGTGIFLLFSAVDLLCLTGGYDLPDVHVSIMSLPDFASVEMDVSILEYALLYKALSLVATLLLTVFLLCLSAVCKKLLISVTVSAGVLFLPMALTVFAEGIPPWLDFTRLLHPTLMGEVLPQLPVLVLLSIIFLAAAWHSWVKM